MNIKNNYYRFIFSLLLLIGISSNVLAETVIRDHRVLKKVEPRATVRDHRTRKIANKTTLGQVLKATEVKKTSGSPGSVANEYVPDTRPLAPKPGKLVMVYTPNLKIDSFGWSREICTGICRDIELDLGFTKSMCDIVVSIRNNGTKAVVAPEFHVSLKYINWKGQETIATTKVTGGLGVNQVKEAIFSSNLIGYYKVNTQFTTKIDVFGKVTEKNESDNTRTF